MKIITNLISDTALYAVEEFVKYVKLITNCEIMPTYEVGTDIVLNDTNIVLTLLDELSLDTSDLKDPFIEDIIDVNIQNGHGYIAGSNERSILMGVYKYCVSAGCRFIRPGVDGEYIPYCNLAEHSFVYRKKADYPFRGECSEGAISYEHMRDTVYWLPKVGCNLFMIEGLVPYAYMNRWYSHYLNKFLDNDKFADYNFLEELIAKLEKDIKKVGIQLHEMGHAWMFEKFGVRRNGSSEMQEAALGEDNKKYLALINGKREIMYGDIFYTQFCYSNPEVRKMLVDICVDVIKKKPYIDFLHIWLADANNNYCECENCAKMSPSDHYVNLLNEIDEAFEKIGSKARLVFILYNETVIPPEKMRLKHPERFVICTAIGLNYENGYSKEDYKGEVPSFELNNFHVPSNEVRMLWYKQWREICNNIPGFIYEYRLYLDHYCDPGYMRIAKEAHRDMLTLEDVGFQGCMSDQTMRSFFPTSLPLSILGETLLDKEINYDKYCDEYFFAAYGEDWEKVKKYLNTLSELFCPSNLRNGGKSGVEEQGLDTIQKLQKTWKNNPDVAAKLALIPDVLNEFIPCIEKNMSLSDACRRKSWIYLKYHSEICRRFAEIFYADANGDNVKANKIREEFEIYLSKIEPAISDHFDLFLYIRNIRFKLGVESK